MDKKLDPRIVLLVCAVGMLVCLLSAKFVYGQSGGGGDPDWLDRSEMVTDWLSVRDHADDLFNEITTGLYDPPTREWLIQDYLLPAGQHIVAAGNAIQQTTASSEPNYLQKHLWIADRRTALSHLGDPIPRGRVLMRLILTIVCFVLILSVPPPWQWVPALFLCGMYWLEMAKRPEEF